MDQTIPFWDRVKLAWRILFNAEFAGDVAAGLREIEDRSAASPAPPERANAPGLMVLAALQREGRLLDFLQQDAAGFSDEDVGAAARVVHGGCRKLLQQFLDLEPAVQGQEGMPFIVPAGFDAQRIRLTGNVAGQPPFKGVLKHHGWVATSVRLPLASDALDPRVIAPAEVELQ